MKTILSLVVFLSVLLPPGRAFSNSGSTYTVKAITVPGDRYDVSFHILWTCDDFPQNSAPGLIELFDSNGQKVGEVAAGVYQGGGPAFDVAGPGSVGEVNWWMGVYSSGGTAADGQLAATWHITGLTPGDYTLRLWRYTTWDSLLRATTVWTTTYFDSGSVPFSPPANSAPTVTMLSPGDQTVTAGTTLTITSHATDPDGNITNHNLDIQRPAGDWNWQGGFATGEPFQGGPVGSAGDSTRSASFTFTDVGTYYVRSAADDGSGWVQSATVAITVVAPPAVQYSLATGSGGGGSVSPGGTYDAGTVVYISATPDGTHDFAGWSGDAGGAANPLAVLIERAKTVQANFAPKNFSLTTNANGGGSVTPGGNYPYGTTVTISAAADATHRFLGWTGDASGNAPTLALTLTQPLAVQAIFEPKTAQTISFPAICDQSVGASFPLTATTTSGLPVTLIVSGPASYAGGVLTLTGPGAVSVQATQSGDGYYLPAAPVTRTFNAAAPVVLRYRATGRTFLQTDRTPESIPYVIQPNP